MECGKEMKGGNWGWREMEREVLDFGMFRVLKEESLKERRVKI